MKIFAGGLVLAATLLTGTLFAQTAKAPAKSLYDRLGGQPAIEAVANGLVDRILADGRVNKWFAHAASTPENTKTYKAHLATFLCSSLGGQCKWTGPDMATIHKNKAVTSEAFDAVAQDLSAQLDQLKVPSKEKGELMTVVGSLKKSIVQSGS
ncbi:MAG TPA: group 1 truncated hemoglobin [Terriglobia bacterium]|jgi:hemoglobin